MNNNIIITIDDDGLGIPENEYQNVFKPFYKLDKSRGDSRSSVGLGLIHYIRYYKITWRKYYIRKISS